MDSHKNPHLETTHNHRLPSPSSSDEVNIIRETTTTCLSLAAAGEDDQRIPPPPPPPNLQEEEASSSRRKMVVVEESGRERLKRHRVEMAGRVWIPDIWGQEDLLKNWIDCTVFDSSLNKSNIMSAREALIQEAATSTSTLSC